MRYLFVLSISFFVCACASEDSKRLGAPQSDCGAQMSPCLNVATFNIGFCRDIEDQIEWNKRKDKITSLVKFHSFDIVGMQEPYSFQLDWLKSALQEYGAVCNPDIITDESSIVSRPDIRKTPGYWKNVVSRINNPIFYKKSRFELLDSGKFWLSCRPDEKLTGGWDLNNLHKNPRHCVWAKFKDKKTGEIFFVFNLHMLVMSRPQDFEIGAKASELVLEKVKSLAGDNAFFIMGDFNATSDRKCIKLLDESGYMRNSRLISKSKPYGPSGSFRGFKSARDNGAIIDYIFVSNNVGVESIGILSDTWGDINPSDHMPVMIKAVFLNKSAN